MAASQRAAGALCLLVVASCIIVPLPPIPSRALSEETIRSLHVGTTRAEVLMTLGNPDRRGEGDAHFGYWWTVTTYAIFGGIPYLAASGDIHSRPNILMIEFDPGGRICRFEELSQEDWPSLNREVEKWLHPPAEGKK